MKTKLLIIAVAVTLVSACTTGTHLAKTYDDDIYFSPADAPPVSMVQNETPVRENQGRVGNSDVRNKRIVMSQVQKNADGSSTLNNNIYQPADSTKNSDYQSYNMDRQNLAGSDTTLYYNDDSVKYVINNYYDENDNDLDYSYRINRFHRPYYYDPFFYDDWNYGGYSPYYSGYNSWGYNSLYCGYGGWGYPYSYGYYSPFSFGFGGYWGGGYGGYGYYDGYYGGGYYGGGYYGGGYYGGGGYYNNYENRDNVRYGRSSDLSNYVVGGNNQRNGSVLKDGSVSRTTRELPGNSSDTRLPNGIYSNSRGQSGNIRSVDATGNNGLVNKSATLINNRREYNSAAGRSVGATSGGQVQDVNNSRSQIAPPGVNTSGTARRSYEPSTTGRTYQQGRAVNQGQNYTPSYNKPRIVNQSNYNNNSYTRPRTSESYQNSSIKSANTGGQSYSAPRSSSSMRQTYRSSSSYSSGSSNSSYRSSGSGYSNSSSSSPSYSAPERSSGSYSSGSSSSGSYSGGSSGSSSSGNSSGGSSGGRSGSGGRR